MQEEPSFAALPLAEPIQRALSESNYTKPSPIQWQAIPAQLEGRDLIGCAQTGTGKTAAFALPILHHLAERGHGKERGIVRALVLTPTRELAVQVGENFTKYGKHLKLHHALVYGGVKQGGQVKALQRGVDILVATPGRLLDLMNQGHLSLNQVEFLVLDEVDRMLDMGFIHDIKRIAKELPFRRQTALFTATLTKDVERVAEAYVIDPVRVEISPDKPVVEKIHQQICFLHPENKVALLAQLINEQAESGDPQLTLVFSRTKYGSDKLVKRLKREGIRSDSIHGNKSQGARQRALDGFRSGKLPVLIATDVAARGIDVKNVTLVVNFDLPDAPDTYVHRIGRTARAEAHGRAVSFCGYEELGQLRDVQRLIGKEIEVFAEHEFHDDKLAEKAAQNPTGRSGGKGKSGKGGPRARSKSKRHQPRSSKPGHADGFKPKGNRSSSGGNVPGHFAKKKRNRGFRGSGA